MVLLGCLARVSRLDVFVVLRLAALAGLALLATGVWRYVRTLSPHRAAPALAAFGLVLLWGTDIINWSGFVAELPGADGVLPERVRPGPGLPPLGLV